MSERQFMTTAEVAKLMHCGRTTVYELIYRKELPATQFGRTWRIDRAELDAYLEVHRNIPLPKQGRKG